jgi:hypothetical protein
VDVLIDVARPRRFRKRKVPVQARETLLQLGYIEQASNGLVLTAEGAHYLAPHLACRNKKEDMVAGRLRNEVLPLFTRLISLTDLPEVLALNGTQITTIPQAPLNYH